MHYSQCYKNLSDLELSAHSMKQSLVGSSRKFPLVKLAYSSDMADGEGITKADNLPWTPSAWSFRHDGSTARQRGDTGSAFPPGIATVSLRFPESLLHMCCPILLRDRKFETGKKEEWDFALFCSELSQLRKHESERLTRKVLWISGEVLWNGLQEEMVRSSPSWKLSFVIHKVQMHFSLYRARGKDCDRILVIFYRSRLAKHSRMKIATTANLVMFCSLINTCVI